MFKASVEALQSFTESSGECIKNEESENESSINAKYLICYVESSESQV